MTTSVTITGLRLYPVKSMQGCALSSAQLCEGGLLGDRQWAVFKADGHMLSQREEPKMALIHVSIENQGLRLTGPNHDSILVREDAISEREEAFPMWKDLCMGARAGREVGQWLEETLGAKTRLDLVKALPHRPRTFRHSERFNVTANYFSDAAPLLVCNEASLAALNASLQEQGLDTIDHRHFRPNIIVSGIEAFDEHRFNKLAFAPAGQSSASEHKLPAPIVQLVDHCQRCAMITVNPSTGVFLPKGYPLKALMRLNTMPGGSRAPAYGVNARTTTEGVGVELNVEQKLAIM